MIATPISQIKLAPGSAMTIAGLTWKTYKALLQELGDDQSTRLITTMLAMELEIEANDFGSVTLNHKELDRGLSFV